MGNSFLPPVRYGMVGGGRGAFIGAVHRIAAAMDGHFRLVAGALSSDPERAKASGMDLGLNPDRIYASYEEMAESESKRQDGIDAVVIVTPNHMHAPPAMKFLQSGFHVICDKPLTATLSEAEQLAETAASAGKVFVLTHNYSGYPMVREARERIRQGDIGEIRLVHAEYPQDWLAEPLEHTGNKQAEWRTDPSRSGPAGCLGDIGTHAFQLLRFVTELRVASVSAELSTFVQGRRVDDNVQAMLRFENGARGMIWASQVAPGNENGLKLRVYGEKGGLEWIQADPTYLWHSPLGGNRQLITRGGAGAGPAAARVTRIPAGHPEGYLEAFATIYSEAAAAIRARDAGMPVPEAVLVPGIDDGLEGMRFIAACIESSSADSAWVRL